MIPKEYKGRDGGIYYLALTNNFRIDKFDEIWYEVKLPENDQIPCVFSEYYGDGFTQCMGWVSDGWFVDYNPYNYDGSFLCSSCFSRVYRNGNDEMDCKCFI